MTEQEIHQTAEAYFCGLWNNSESDAERELIPTLKAASDLLKEQARELERLIGAFKHMHVNNGLDDSCDKCGLDLRDPIHRVFI